MPLLARSRIYCPKGGFLLLTLCVLFGEHGARDVHYLDNGCPRPASITNGNFRLALGNRDVTYECDPGSSLIGEAKSSCNSHYWDRDPPLCIRSGCPQLEALSNGYMELSYSGALANFRCEDGYQLEGVVTLACDGMQWNGTQPVCKDIYGRAESKPEKNSYSYAYEDNQHKRMLQTADYSCIGHGYTLAPPKVFNAVPTTKYESLDGSPRLYTVYRCKWGFVTAGGQTAYLYCSQRKWVGDKPKCVTKVDTVSNSLYNTYEKNYQRDQPTGQSSHEDWLRYADYTCFTTSGDVTAPHVRNARTLAQYSGLGGDPHLYVEYRCEDGYSLQRGSGYMYCKKKDWLGDQPECVWQSNAGQWNAPQRAALPTDPPYKPRSRSSDRQRKRNRNRDGNRKERRRNKNRGTGGGYEFRYDSRYNNEPTYQYSEQRAPEKVTVTDPCQIDNGGCDQLCSEANGRRVCGCMRGYKLYTDGTSCADINECQSNNGNCDQTCTNSRGSYKCSCRHGYFLYKDGHTCVGRAHKGDGHEVPPLVLFHAK